MRVTSKGQVTIPADIRQRFGFLPGTEVEFVVENDAVRLQRADRPGHNRGDNIVRRLRGSARAGMSTDEILALTRQA